MRVVYLWGKLEQIGWWRHSVNHFHICGPYSQVFKYSVSFIAIFPRPQHQFCHERTLILQQYWSTELTRWGFYNWRQRLLVEIKESDH